jgi:two-component system, OmpR family, response regulator
VRLLLVEDDAKLVRALERGLRREGYAVDVAATGDAGIAQATASEYDVVVLDVMLPGPDGFAVCRALREAERGTPVLMLTARTEVSDRIRGLDAGADDYLVKPFDFGELLARLRALVRRGPSERAPVLRVGDLQFDAQRRVVTQAGAPVELTTREFEVLELLARHAGRVVSRARLLEEIWTEEPEISPNIVDVYVGYLRRKLADPPGGRRIRTVRGVGFVLELE